METIDFTQTFQYSFPTLIRFGSGISKEIGPHLKAQNLSRPLVVTDPGFASLPLFKELVATIAQAQLSPTVYCEIQKNPIKRNVLGGAEAFKKNNCDAIIGIGGGASLDVARAIALKVNHPRDLFDYEDSKGGEHLVTEPIPYFITVPTTSGTGSEVGRSTVISDDVTHQKKIMFSPRLLAKAVFADPSLTLSLPPMVTAATGIDALTHHIEAYLSKGFHPMCDGIALEGIRLIRDSLETAVKRPDLESRSKMMIAALMGAVAFQKGLGVIHSTAHPLSTLFDLHHGTANALMLAHGVAFNADVSAARLVRVAEALRLATATPAAVADYLGSLVSALGLPTTLSSQGIDKKDIDALAALALEDVCHSCNPKPVTLADFKMLYEKAL